MSKVRSYCLTFFTKPSCVLPDKVRYAIYGEEICPTTNKVHWQSYIEFFKPQRFAAVKKMYNDNSIHIEERRGTREQARDYCKKDNNYTEHGDWISGQGSRSDLREIVKGLTEGGTSLHDFMLENPAIYCAYRNGLKDIAAEITKRKTSSWRELNIILYTGPTGCGKTRSAMNCDNPYKIEGYNLSWWQDYCGEKIIVIDEYDNNVPITQMLNFLDGYKLRLNVKGSHTYAAWEEVHITTNLRLEELHANAKPAHRKAFFRRISEIRDFWPKSAENSNTAPVPGFVSSTKNEFLVRSAPGNTILEQKPQINLRENNLWEELFSEDEKSESE